MKRTLCLFLALILAVGICFSAPVTITASAAESVSYVDYTWDEESKTLSSETKSVDTYTEITSATTEMTSGWYVVNGEVTVAERMTATGEVHLILADGAHLTASEGITVNEGNYLYIYGQSSEESTMGKLTATTNDSDAAIGGLGSNHAGTIVINGGNINASTSNQGAGIGSGLSRGGYQITINAGVVTATSSYTGAAIGSGDKYRSYDQGTVHSICINGGVVNATVTAMYGAAIGGGYRFDGGDITITGGTVTATNNGMGAAIGGGYSGNGGNITITGGTVTATNNGAVVSVGDNYYAGAAIGAGCNGDGAGNILVTGGTVTATSKNGCGIGNNVGNGRIVILGGTVNASGDSNYGNITAGDSGSMMLVDGTTVTISGDFTLQTDFVLSEGYTLKISEGATLTIPEGVTFTLPEEYTLINNGTFNVVGTVNCIKHKYVEGVCICGFKCNHVGGTPTCKTPAECTTCGMAYLTNHNWENGVCTYGCNTIHEPHDWSGKDGICTVCGAPCSHSGGTATCKKQAICGTCGVSYGEFGDHTYKNGKCTGDGCEIVCSHEIMTDDDVCTTCGGNYYGADKNKDKVVWFYDEYTDTLTITGSGDMFSERSVDDEVLWKIYYINSVEKIDIEYGVTSIGDSAFLGCESLTSVTIPDSIETIGKNAFYWCTALTSVEIPERVKSIGNNAFNGCSSLTSVEIPERVETIGNNAFYGCSSLTTIEIPESVTSIGDYAFSNCTSLTSVEIPESVETIGKDAFNNCQNLTSITIPQSVTVIGEGAFCSCAKLTEINVDEGNTTYSSEDGVLFNANKTELICYPAGKEVNYEVPTTVTEIASAAFRGNTSLESVTIPVSVTSIGKNAFQACSELTSVTIPDSVTFIGNYAFSNCKKLILTVEPGSYAHNYAKTNSIPYIFNGYTKEETAQIEKLIFTLNADSESYSVTGCDTQISGELKIPATYNGKPVTEIGNYAFSACTALATVTIPDSVTTIGNYTFNACRALATVTIPDSVTTIGNYTFNDCRALATVTIGKDVTTIGDYAFNGCTNILLFVDKKNINVQNYATDNNINYVVDGSGELGKLTFTPIYKEADNENSEITGYSVTARDKTISGALTIPSEYNGYSVTTIGDSAFYCCESLTSVTIPDSITTIGADAFNYCIELISITIPDNVTTIGYCAFLDCLKLSDITIGKSVERIYDYTFGYCESLEAIKIPDSVQKIDYCAFYKCKNLKSVMVGSAVEEIGMYAFSECSLLKEIKIPDSVQTIEDYAFDSCTLLETAIIGNGVKTIGDFAFGKCENLKSLTIGEGVETIGGSAFNQCSALTDVVIPKSVTTIGNNAFNGCTNILLFVDKSNTAVQKYATTNNINYVVDGSGELEKLTFSINEDGESYSVTDCDKTISGALTIPSEFNGKPVTEIGNNAFWNCKSLTSVVIPDSVVSLGEKAFYVCVSLETVTLSSNITVIPKEAFAYCESLKTLPITENVASIGECAFYGSGKYSKVSLSGVTIGSEAFRFCGITELTLEKCKLNDASAFINNKIEKLAILETDIPDEMFGNSYIKTLVAENSVLGAGAFSSCSGLENVTVSEGEIKSDAFYNCQALKTVEVNATEISKYAFSMCTSLENVKLSDGVEVIEKNAFEECRELTEIVIPESVTSIDAKAFYSCSNLKCIFFKGTEDAQKTIGDALETNAKIHYGSSTHTFNENYTVDVEPTCTEKGSESQHCKYCDLTQNVTNIDKLGHTPVNGGTEGAHTICDVCEDVLSAEHEFASKITTEPTYTKEGIKTFTCGCGYSYEEVIPCLVPGEIKAEEAESNSFSATVVDINSIVTKLQLTEEEKALIEQGADMKIVFKLSDIGATINTPEKEAIFKALTNEKIAVFLDIQLVKQIANSSVNVQKLNDLIKVTVELPSEFINKDGNIKRSYSVLRYHDGDETKVTTLNAKFDEATGTLTFDTDRFSTYAIVYSDVVVSNGEGAPGTPDSGDGEVSTPETPKDETTPNTPETPKDDVSSDKTDDSVTNDKNDASSETGTNDKNDTSKDDVPKAGVISTTSIWLGAMALSGLGALLVSKKKKED